MFHIIVHFNVLLRLYKGGLHKIKAYRFCAQIITLIYLYKMLYGNCGSCQSIIQVFMLIDQE